MELSRSAQLEQGRATAAPLSDGHDSMMNSSLRHGSGVASFQDEDDVGDRQRMVEGQPTIDENVLDEVWANQDATRGCHSRWPVYAIILLTGVALSTATFLIIDARNMNNTRTEADQRARVVVKFVQQTMKTRFGLLQSFATGISSDFANVNASNLVSVPNFDIKASRLGTALADDAFQLIYAPLTASDVVPVTQHFATNETFDIGYDLSDDTVIAPLIDAAVRTGTLAATSGASELPGQSVIVHPIHRSLPSTGIAGVLVDIITWTDVLRSEISLASIDDVLLSSCNGVAWSYRYDRLYEASDIPSTSAVMWTTANCETKVVAVSESRADQDPRAAAGAAIVAVSFAAILLAMLVYDKVTGYQRAKLELQVHHTHVLLSSFLPQQPQPIQIADKPEGTAATESMARRGSTALIREYLEESADFSMDEISETYPQADLFLNTTVMYADIVGFTAWSSMREPSQIFMLLETVYAAFDDLARRRRVFKVETIGDCYVAAAGIPQPQADHALIMARFARDCVVKMGSLTRKLETLLGPDTSSLSIRIGLHSGHVTAGILRGERSRLQLFGDTVTMAARMETSGERNRIQASQETAELLTKAGKQHWLQKRPDLVHVDGIGNVQTCWLELTNRSSQLGSLESSAPTELASTVDDVEPKPILTSFVTPKVMDSKQKRLVQWNTSLLASYLRAIMVRRISTNLDGPAPDTEALATLEAYGLQKPGNTVLDEVSEVIKLPRFNANRDVDAVELPTAVEEQLQDYVQTIAALYRDNNFHNFEHASHVCMSTVKLLSRINAPNERVQGQVELHDHTYGISSDPILHFAVVLAALIHDVDHVGVPNATLIAEKASVAAVYKYRSVAEQNSVDIAWNLLMDEAYGDLRRAIYGSVDEFHRFRQVLVNAVLATDIMDKELGSLRKARWNKAFARDKNAKITSPAELEMAVDRKATIVLEHLIQASDVAHTMQHWHVYRKWNERLFLEMYQAYVDGRAATDPSTHWYEGELGFLDFYIVPLAKKLKDCGVFGVSSDEYLDYATQNRREWEHKGREVVQGMLELVKKKEDEG